MEREEVSRGVVTSSRPPGAVTEPPAQSSAGTLGRARSGLGSRTRQPADHLSPAQTVAATSATPPSWPPTGGSTPGSDPSPVTSAGPFLPARGPAPASAHPHRGKSPTPALIVGDVSARGAPWPSADGLTPGRSPTHAQTAKVASLTPTC